MTEAMDKSRYLQKTGNNRALMFRIVAGFLFSATK